MIALSYFSEIVDKKRKIANYFRNASYENKLSEVVKLIAKWVVHVIKLWKKDQNAFLWIDIALVISDICGNSRRQIFNIKKALQLKIEEENLSTLKNLSKDPCFVRFKVFLADQYHKPWHQMRQSIQEWTK